MKPALAITAVIVALLVWPGCKDDSPQQAQGRIKRDWTPELTAEMTQRLAAAEARYKHVKGAARMGMTEAQALEALGKPTSKTPAAGPAVAETWRYDIDTHVYYVLDFNAAGVVVGTGGSGIKFLVESMYAQVRRSGGNT